MKVTTEKTGPSEYVLNVQVEPDRIEKPLHEAAQRLTRRRPIPGFRPGKAPYSAVVRTFGRDAVFDEMLDKMGNVIYQEALQSSKLEPYDAASFKIVELEPLQLQFTVPVQPTVTLGDYKSIRVALEEPQVTDEDVEQVINQIREENALWIPVERPAQMGDQMTLDAAIQPEDVDEFNREDLMVELTEQMTPPELGQQLTGLSIGETKEFDIQYPEEFQDKQLAGKKTHFRVTVKGIKEKEMPELDDELAKTVGEYETLDALRARIREQLLQQRTEAAREAAIEQALDQLVEQATIEYPARAVEQEIDSRIADLSQRLERQGFKLDRYLSIMNKSMAEWREELRPEAETSVKRALVMSQFAEDEKIEVTPEDVNAEVEELASRYGEQAEAAREALSTAGALHSIEHRVYDRKAFDRLLAIATGAAPATEEAPPEAGEQQ